MTQGKPVARIALTIATRGDVPAYDIPTYRGARIAMDELAGRDDLPFTFELVSFDDVGVPDQAAAFAKQITADPSFVAAIGPMGSDEAFANTPIFSDAGMLQVSPCASHPDLCRRGYQTFFRLVPNEETQGSELARVAHQFLKARVVTVVADNDKFGLSVADYFTRGFEAAGGTVASLETFSRGEKDFTVLASRVIASEPDVVFFAVHALEGGLVSNAIRDAGLRVPFLGTDGLKTSFFLGGGDDRGESFHTHTGADFRRLESARDFGREYAARHPADSTYSPEAYDCVMLVAEAVLNANSTNRADVLAAFKARNGSAGITGTLQFDESGERVGSPVSLYQVVKEGDDRQMKYLGTTEQLCPVVS